MKLKVKYPLLDLVTLLVTTLMILSGVMELDRLKETLLMKQIIQTQAYIMAMNK